jgi:peptidyl-prolyl cis-trans isomerase C
MKRQVIILALALAGFPVRAQMLDSHESVFEQAAPRIQTTGRPVARVNGVVLTDHDLLREMYMIFPYAQQHNGAFPKAMEPDIRKGAMKMIVFEELVYQESKRRGMTVASARLNRAVKEFQGQFKTPEQYKLYVDSEAQGSLKLEVTDKAVVTVARARAYYDKNPDKFKVPETFALQTITMMPPQNPSAKDLADVKKRAENALEQANATKDYETFGVLAERVSEDDYRVMMGDHRAVDVARIPEPLLAELRRLQVGQITGIVQVEQSYTIARLNAHTPAGIEKFDDIKNDLKSRLQQNKTEQLRASLNKQLRKTATVEEL